MILPLLHKIVLNYGEDPNVVYNRGYNAGVTAADNRVNASSTNYQAGYNAGKASVSSDSNMTVYNLLTPSITTDNPIQEGSGGSRVWNSCWTCPICEQSYWHWGGYVNQGETEANVINGAKSDYLDHLIAVHSAIKILK